MPSLSIQQALPPTSLTVTNMTAIPHHTITYDWTISKSVTPDTWNLFKGDSATSQYSITVSKGQGTERAWITGLICVRNTGSNPTEGLAITVSLERRLPGETNFTTIVLPQPVDVSGASVLYPVGSTLGPSEFCYNYSVDVPDNMISLNATYRVFANITILNHPGGTTGTQARVTTTLPAATTANNSISVEDTNGPIPNSSDITDTTTLTYEKTFTCDADEGTHKNTATIISESPVSIQSASATVTINCYSLDVTKDATTEFTRKYTWDIVKSISEDQVSYGSSANFVLAVRESHLAYYRVTVTPQATDTNYMVSGTINIVNPAPISAAVIGVNDIISGVNGNVPVTCENQLPFLLAGGSTETCTYATTSGQITNNTSRTNTATVTIQNYNYRFDNNVNNPPQPIGTTSFEGTANIAFGSTPTNEVDKCVEISDTMASFVGTATAPNSTTLNYQGTVGPYSSCGPRTVPNTATVTTVKCPDGSSTGTGTTTSATATANVNVSCTGCTHTIGYWKTHAGFTGNNPDKVTPLLPIWLGTPSTGKSIQITTATQAVNFLNFVGNPANTGGASNGINKLYAQLLAARLNQANGADTTAIATTLADADTQLALYNSSDWNLLNRTQRNYINQLASILDNYNNGLIGPPHCSESNATIEPIPPVEEEDTLEDNCCCRININITNSGTVKIYYKGNEISTIVQDET